jgi:hypothetical protein
MKNQEELDKELDAHIKIGEEKGYGVYTIIVKIDGAENTFFLKEPGRNETTLLQKGLMGDSMIKGTESFIHTCYLGGEPKTLLFLEKNWKALRQMESAMLDIIKVEAPVVKKN